MAQSEFGEFRWVQNNMTWIPIEHIIFAVLYPASVSTFVFLSCYYDKKIHGNDHLFLTI